MTSTSNCPCWQHAPQPGSRPPPSAPSPPPSLVTHFLFASLVHSTMSATRAATSCRRTSCGSAGSEPPSPCGVHSHVHAHVHAHVHSNHDVSTQPSPSTCPSPTKAGSPPCRTPLDWRPQHVTPPPANPTHSRVPPVLIHAPMSSFPPLAPASTPSTHTNSRPKPTSLRHTLLTHLHVLIPAARRCQHPPRHLRTRPLQSHNHGTHQPQPVAPRSAQRAHRRGAQQLRGPR